VSPVRPARVGNKSFTLEYRIEQGGELLVEGNTVLVSYDYERAESRPVPEAWRDALQVPA